MNAKEYRTHYKNIYRANTDALMDIDFIGCYKKDLSGKIEKKGFIELTHGDKPKIKDFIESQVKIAEDGQAIYEFLQNAVDANSTSFSVYFDKDNFLVINNGDKFELENTRSILNFSQSTKTEKEQQIGKFGVGFKLIHRLVGKESAIEEIIDKYKGPILFSWDDFYIKKLLENDLSEIDKHWLFKIIYTSFPCGVDETIKNELYEPINPFSTKDLGEMIAFIKEQNIEFDKLEKGSLFFLKLGENKAEVLNREISDLEVGISTSLNILNYLRGKKEGIAHININQTLIQKDNLKILSNGEYVFLYPALNFINEFNANLNKKVSFFKFFPMGDQTNKLNFIVHSYKFEVETNRRKLQKDGKNKEILSDIWKDLKAKLEEMKKSNKKEFAEVLANLYLSDLENANKEDTIQSLTEPMFNFIKNNIPYLFTNVYGIDSLHTTSEKSKVVIVDSELNNIPLKKRYHFYFNLNEYEEIVKEAVKKLKLQRWNLVKVIIEDEVNDWLLKLSENDFKKATNEIDEYKKDYSQQIVNKWNDGIYNLDEIKKILQIFGVLDKNIQFAVIKDESNSYRIINTKRNDFIKNRNLKEFLEKTYELIEMEYYLIPEELEDEITKIIGKTSSDKKILENLLDANQHAEVIDFVNEYELNKKFIDTLSKLELNTSDRYTEASYELKVLDIVLKLGDDLDLYKQKIYIDGKQIAKLSKSPYISFKFQSEKSKVVNPNSYDNDNKLSEKILDFIEKIGDKYGKLFNIQEEPKESIYLQIKKDIQEKNSYKLKNKINTKNRLKFIILYSLENSTNYISAFNGVKIFNHDTQSDESIKEIYKIFRDDIAIQNDTQLDIFKISDFFPDINKDYYVKENDFAVDDEKLPVDFKNEYIEVFKKIGLLINDELPILRKKLFNHENIESDYLIQFSQKQLENTLEFLSNKRIEYTFDKSENIKKIFKKLENSSKSSLEYLPVLKTKNTFCFKKIDRYLPKEYIFRSSIDSPNNAFQTRLENEIENKNIIYMDILDLEKINIGWTEIRENEEEKKEQALSDNRKKIDDIRKNLHKKSEYSEKMAEIGRLGEEWVHKLLIQKFGPDRVKHNNAKGESQKIDFEILDKDLKNTIHYIEVKATIKEANQKNDDVAFYMSSEQYQKALQYGSNTHLIFVTGVETENPEFLYMNFDKSWIELTT